ncbi:hypothetical protein CPB86DRAFT_779170 [Serendipita vermifera]|nr:hypothetical protein CPB86DRAFT_779170 [Serendipita vermifera]
MSSFFASFAPNHVNLVNACYPSSSVLLASGSTFQPLSQELSRLTYYASNKADSSGKLAKIGIELEKRASAEARKARSGNARGRAQLLVTMSIFKAVANECKRDIGVLTKMILAATRDALICLPNDLELQARVASLFIAWATYTDGRMIGPDIRVTSDYVAILKIFLERCTYTGKDSEQVYRMRLIGIAAMTAAVSSDSFYASPSEIPRQVAIVIPALLTSLHDARTDLITTESTSVTADTSLNSPYLSEFQPRPVMDRRAASIHAHIDGQKGPELSDVVNASLRGLRVLLGRCNGNQTSIVFDAILQNLDSAGTWGNVELENWYAEHMIEWTQYQYRYAIPSQLVQRLLAWQDSSPPEARHLAIIEMLTSIFDSPSPVINLSTSDIISSLMNVLLRRINISPSDTSLNPLVRCISSLGTHVYYADQIHDLAEEVVARIVDVQVNGVLGRGRGGSEQGREVALRCLLSCLSGLTEAADRHAAKAKAAEEGETPNAEEVDGTRTPSESTTTTLRASRRNKVSPESWQETLALLCESDYGIRAMYARGLATFVQREVRREPFVQSVDGSGDSQEKRVKVVVDPEFKVSSRPSILAADEISRFSNALHATAYRLATSTLVTRNLQDPSAQPTKQTPDQEPPSANINVIPPSTSTLPTPSGPLPIAIDFVVKPPSAPSSPDGGNDQAPPTATSASSFAQGSEFSPISPQDSGKRRSKQHSGARKLSVALSLLEGGIAVGVNTTLSDIALLRGVLSSMHRQIPCRSVLTGVPMLLALTQFTRKVPSTDAPSLACARALRELICQIWIIIGEVWDVPSIVECASKALESLSPRIVPQLDNVPPTQLHPPEKPINFPTEIGPLHSDISGIIDTEVVLPALASSSGLQAITGLDRQNLLRRFMIEWTVEAALKDSVEHTSSQDILRGETPFLKISPALMHIDNMSLASLARSTHGGVGVSDLREALGRGSISNPALATASLSSTVERSSSIARRLDKNANHPEPLAISRIKSKRGKAPPSEVRDVLNKLGIGKQSNTSTTLRTPFLPSQKASNGDLGGDKDISLAEPPY